SGIGTGKRMPVPIGPANRHSGAKRSLLSIQQEQRSEAKQSDRLWLGNGNRLRIDCDVLKRGRDGVPAPVQLDGRGVGNGERPLVVVLISRTEWGIARGQEVLCDGIAGQSAGLNGLLDVGSVGVGDKQVVEIDVAAKVLDLGEDV